jgi:hypothetical protein
MRRRAHSIPRARIVWLISLCDGFRTRQSLRSRTDRSANARFSAESRWRARNRPLPARIRRPNAPHPRFALSSRRRSAFTFSLMASESAFAVGAYPAGAGAISAQSHIVQAQARPRAKAAPRSVAPRRAAPRRVAPVRRVAPRRASPRRPAPVYRWTRDRRHRFYGTFFAVPFGFALYAAHPCYDWRFGRQGWGYYWNYRRCPL